MSKRKLMKVLYYCPDSSFYYDSWDVMKKMEEEWTHLEVHQKVMELINKATKAVSYDIPVRPGPPIVSSSLIKNLVEFDWDSLPPVEEGKDANVANGAEAIIEEEKQDAAN